MAKARTGRRLGLPVPLKSYVLDTSAVLALMEDEPGADRVEAILRSERVLLPFVAKLEVYYLSFQKRGEAIANQRYAMLRNLRAVHVDEVDEPTLLTAGRFKARHKLSLADALISACAARHQAILVHKDPEYEPLAGYVEQEVLPYKGKS